MINYLDPDFNDTPGTRTVPRNYKRADVVCEQIDVSIVTPFYNTGEIFVETFISLQAQSLQNWEWTIVDDGSPDATAVTKLLAIAKMDTRIKVVRQDNAGTAVARNTGYLYSAGRYICLLDHDDMLEPTYLEKCVWFLDSNPEFSFVNSYNVMFGEQNFLWTSGFEKREQYLHLNSAPPFAVIRRSAWEECGGFDGTIRILYEDWDFWLAMANCGHWGYTIPEYLQWYRKLGGGRYEQLLQSGYKHADFSRDMRAKYPGLAHHFPRPSLHQPQPYDSIETTSLVSNPLAANPLGRRVMFIVPWMVTGGADRVNLDLIDGLTANGHDVTICATLLADHRWEHLYTHFTPDVFVLPNFLSPADYPRFLDYLIRSRQIDTVVITGSTIGYQLLPYLRAVTNGVAFVDISHVEEPHWWNGGHPRFGVGYQDLLDLNIVTTQHLANWMQERGANPERVKVMYSGVRTSQDSRSKESRDQIRFDLNISLDIPLLVFIGRICEQKRPLLLADILKQAHDRGLKFRVVILGDGEQRVQLHDLLRKYGLSGKVQLLGSVSHQRWLDILVAADIFLMPSKYEGISIALLEAMAAGVVPVVSNVGGQEEVVSPDAGILIPIGDTEVLEYVRALERLLLSSDDLEKMSKQCISVANKKLSMTGMISNFETLLDAAHIFKNEQPRNPITPNFGRELALRVLEYRPLGTTEVSIEKLRDRGIALLPDSLINAVYEDDIALAILLLEAGVDPNARDKDGNLCLVEASWRSNLDMISKLLDYSANVNGVSSLGKSALGSAVFNQQPDLVRLLLQRGANPNAAGPEGSTPLIDAATVGCYNSVRELLLKGANPNYRRARDGVTALKAAVTGNWPRIAHLLRAMWAIE